MSFSPRPTKRAGARIPVHIMRRFFSFLGGGRCQGIDVSHLGDLNTVQIHFSTAAEASGFYRSIEIIYAMAEGRK